MKLINVFLIVYCTVDPSVYSWDISMYNYVLMGIRPEIENEISFQYYTGPTLDDYTKLSLKDGLQILLQQSYDKFRKTVFLFHGWSERPSEHNDYSSDILAHAFLQHNGANFIVVNYENLVQHYHNITSWTPELVNMGAGYVNAVQNTTQIGAAVGQFLQKFLLLCNCENNLHLIGFSIGAQIISYVTALYGNGRLKRLTALDAAGPIYEFPGYDHLDVYDGVFIDAIHTDSGMFGYGSSFGKVDFYPNFGRSIQPECLTSTIMKCSHYMSLRYYAESVVNPKAFPARKCPSPILWSTYMCNGNDFVYMGYSLSSSASGDHFLKTAAAAPYGLGNGGLTIA